MTNDEFLDFIMEIEEVAKSRGYIVGNASSGTEDTIKILLEKEHKE